MTWQTLTNRATGDLIPEGDWDQLLENLSEIGGAWTAYTPTLGGWTQGNGTVDGAYRLAGKRLLGRCYFSFGSTSAAAASGATFTLPTGTPVAEPQSVDVVAFDDSAGVVYAAAGLVPASTATITTSVTSSLFTFATSDLIVVNFAVEIA